MLGNSVASVQLDSISEIHGDNDPFITLSKKSTWSHDLEVPFSRHVAIVLHALRLSHEAQPTATKAKRGWNTPSHTFFKYVLFAAAKHIAKRLNDGKATYNGIGKSVYDILVDPPKSRQLTTVTLKEAPTAYLIQSIHRLSLVKGFEENPECKVILRKHKFLYNQGQIPTDALGAILGSLLKLVALTSRLTSFVYDDLRDAMRQNEASVVDDAVTRAQKLSWALELSVDSLLHLTNALDNNLLPWLQKISLDAGEDESNEQQNSWPKVAEAYINSLLSHDRSLKRLLFPAGLHSVAFASHLKNLRVHFVKCERVQHDQQEAAHDTGINEVLPLPSENTEAFRHALGTWIESLAEEKCRLFDPLPNYKRGEHPEMTLLSLYLLVQELHKIHEATGGNRDDLKNLVASHFRKADHDIAPSVYLKLCQMKPNLGTSSPCCPSCHSLAKQALGKQHKVLGQIDCHRNWTGVDVPSFLPKKYLDVMEAEGKRRILEWLQKRMGRRDDPSAS